jgi:hypothetical protein
MSPLVRKASRERMFMADIGSGGDLLDVLGAIRVDAAGTPTSDE